MSWFPRTKCFCFLLFIDAKVVKSWFVHHKRSIKYEGKPEGSTEGRMHPQSLDRCLLSAPFCCHLGEHFRTNSHKCRIIYIHWPQMCSWQTWWSKTAWLQHIWLYFIKQMLIQIYILYWICYQKSFLCSIWWFTAGVWLRVGLTESDNKRIEN